MRAFGYALLTISALSVSVLAQAPQAGKNLTWAYPVPDPTSPGGGPDNVKKTLQGSSRSYTQAQIDDQFNPPDWFPDEHGPLPNVVQKGIQAQACGSCHLMSGMGHPESAALARLPGKYLQRQMEGFKAGLRKEPQAH